MKTIGLIGGMSWESSAAYYRLLNEEVKARLGGLHSAQCLMFSVEFAEIEELQRSGDWDRATELMVDAGRRLEAGGADCVLICTNTMHRMAEDVAAAVSIPLIHIAEVTAAAMKSAGVSIAGLLGTNYTMEGTVYDGYQIEMIVPPPEARQIVHQIIYDELCLGLVRDESRQAYLDIINNLVDEGARGIVLACTELTLLNLDDDCAVPIFDTTKLHALAAVDFALEAS
jgi:aspartate racemase